jgi:hypothetical protein
MAVTTLPQSRVIQFPARSPQLSKEERNLLAAAKAAHAALRLAIPQSDNLIIRNLGIAIEAAENPQPPRTPAPAKKTPRCEVSYSFGADLTGERAVICGQPADVECEHCGPICLGCFAEVSCLGPEHKILQTLEAA